jgi:hypothetical protein
MLPISFLRNYKKGVQHNQESRKLLQTKRRKKML